MLGNVYYYQRAVKAKGHPVRIQNAITCEEKLPLGPASFFFSITNVPYSEIIESVTEEL